MGQLILHHNGAYNLYSTISDGPYYESALTLDQLREAVKEEAVARAMEELERRLERAHQFGCSCGYGTTLTERIQGNRAGPDDTRLSPEKFIAQFLTLPTEDSDV
jgi:hypothetical protein